MIISKTSVEFQISHNRKRTKEQPTMPLGAIENITSDLKKNLLRKRNSDYESTSRDLAFTPNTSSSPYLRSRTLSRLERFRRPLGDFSRNSASWKSSELSVLSWTCSTQDS